MNTFTKVQGDVWGLRIVGGEPPIPASKVTVHKKDGSSSIETVGTLLQTVEDAKTKQPVYICSIMPKTGHRKAPRKFATTTRGVKVRVGGGRPRCTVCGNWQCVSVGGNELCEEE